jgi:hypothetical protein
MKCRYKSLQLFFFGFWLLLITGCSKLKDDRNAITDESLKMNLFEVISANAQLSTFATYLKQTGYDKVISSSKNYTVFAPVNSSLSNLDPGTVSDPAKLKKFVGNHIANQLYSTKEIVTATRIPMLNGKYNNMLRNKIGDANISSGDQYAANGLVQVIDQFVPALDNSWDFLSTHADAPAKQKAFMLSLFRNVFDTTNAVVVGINPLTGDPIYAAGTDSVFTNLFWNRVHDLKKEDKQYTLFMLTDAAWDAEVAKFKPYFVTNTNDSNTLVTSWNVVKEFAVDTVYNPASIPDTILSEFGTKLPIEKSAIVKTIKTSNGIVYIMNKMNVLPASKFKTLMIEGEQYSSTSHDRRNNTYFREKFNTMTQKDFTDVMVQNHGVSLFNIRYNIPEVPSIKYKAYWVAVNDFQAASFTQKLGIGIPTSTIFGYTTVAAGVYSEVYIGEFTMAKYEPVFPIYLTAANSTAVAVNPLVCDYIKLVPSL